MATVVFDDNEDFVTCGVCFYQYDIADKKPKFLQCFHTVCLSCAKALFSACKLICPFCRHSTATEEPNKLPNNNYATQLLKLMEKSKKTSSKAVPRKISSMRWCSICRMAGNLQCTVLGHTLISVSSEAVMQMEKIIERKTELMKLKDQGMDILPQIIQKRKLIKENLHRIMKSIYSPGEELRKLRDNNDLFLAKFTSMLEHNKQLSSAKKSFLSAEEKDDLLTSELKTLMDDFSADDSMDTLKWKMEKALNMFSKNLQEATSTASRYETKEEIHVTRTGYARVEPISTLSSSDKNNFQHTTVENVKPKNAIDRAIPSNSFVVGKSIFILKINFGTVTENIWIQSCHTDNDWLLQRVGTYCYKSPKQLKSCFKAVPGIYVLLSGVSVGPSVQLVRNPITTRALRVNEVGIQIIQNTVHSYPGNAETEWNMIFPLRKFNDSNCVQHVGNLKAELIGKIVNGSLESLTKLSSTSTRGRQFITFTLESV